MGSTQMNSRKLDSDLLTGVAFVVGVILGVIFGAAGGSPIVGAILTGVGFAVVTMVVVSIYNGIVK